MSEIITTRCSVSGEEVQLYANNTGVSTNCENCRVARMSFTGRAFDRAEKAGYPLNGEVPFCRLRLDSNEGSIKDKLIDAFGNHEYGEIRCKKTHFRQV